MVPELLEILDFRSNNEIIPNQRSGGRKGREFVVEKDSNGSDSVNRLNYEVCVLQALRERVRVREIWVMGANHYRNLDNDLPTDFSQKRDIYEALHQLTEADTFIEQIKGNMRKALRLLDVAMPRILNKVKLLPNRKKPICLSPLDPGLNPAIW